MKKFLSLVLAAIMLLSCTSAFATFVEDIEVREPDDRYTGADVTSIGEHNTALTNNTPKTELWLQVDANGQIDVTVPLVLVFKTNIDGGEATTADDEEYKITNHSSANLVVTEVKVHKEDEDTATQPMTLTAYADSYDEDYYGVQLTAETAWNETNKAYNGTYTFDFNDAEDTETAKNGGLFYLAKAPVDDNETGTPTEVKVDMGTGKLSFITTRTEDDTDLKTENGVKLLTLTYKVAINTKDTLGTAITDNGDSTVNGVD